MMMMDDDESAFRFWSANVKAGGKHSPKIKDNEILHLATCALGTNVKDGRTSLVVESDNSKGIVCTLTPNKAENARFELVLQKKAVLHAKGVNPLHVCGYVQPLQTFDSMDDLDEMAGMPEKVNGKALVQSADSSDEGVPVENPAVDSSNDESPESPAPVQKKAAAKKEKKPNKKKRKLEEAPEASEESSEQPPKKKNKKKKKKKEKGKKKESPKAAPATPTAVDEEKAESQPSSPKSTSSKKKKKKKKKEIQVGKGVSYRVIKGGDSDSPPAKKGTAVTLRYIGQLSDGTQFDKNITDGLSAKLGSGDLIPGMDAGLMGIKLKEKRRISVPASQAYGEDGAADGAIPPNADLTFTVERTA